MQLTAYPNPEQTETRRAAAELGGAGAEPGEAIGGDCGIRASAESVKVLAFPQPESDFFTARML